ncbi:MAG TPA: hypothetical protein VD862_04865 [Candidatus Paceibacterota bacterium]|nr:hypothetical protein [Candidatus Paceibacterota bacterium]
MFIIRSHDGQYEAKADSAQGLEDYIRQSPAPGRVFQVDIPLDITLNAVVVRHKGEPDTVYLASGGRTVGLTRDTHSSPGDVGVSCNPDGDVVVVDSINVGFREIGDVFTDRGIVWVVPGEPANAFLHINAGAGEIPGLVRNIAEQALAAINGKVLKHFVTKTA